jgi:hypothetical protein
MLNEEQLTILAYITSLKASARAEEIKSAGLGKYSIDNPLVQSLVSQKYLTVNKAGSITPDREKIRSTLKTYPHPQKYKMWGLNSHWLFKRDGE